MHMQDGGPTIKNPPENHSSGPVNNTAICLFYLSSVYYSLSFDRNNLFQSKETAQFSYQGKTSDPLHLRKSLILLKIYTAPY